MSGLSELVWFEISLKVTERYQSGLHHLKDRMGLQCPLIRLLTHMAVG